MPVGVVALDAVAQPENFAHAKIIAQPLLNLLPRKLRIAIWIEQTSFGGEQRACAVHLDRAAFQYHVRIINRQTQRLCHARRDDLIEIARRILAAPGIVIPIDHRQSRILGAGQKNRPVITAPRLVGRDHVKGQSCSPGRSSSAARASASCAPLQTLMIDRLRLEQRCHHRAESRHHAIVGIGKTDSLPARPGKPGGGVRFPFRRHAVTERGGFGGSFVVRHDAPKLASSHPPAPARDRNRAQCPGSDYEHDQEPRASPPIL